MAYETEDLCPPDVSVKTMGKTLGTDCGNTKMNEAQDVAAEILSSRSGDDDFYPRRQPPQFVDIARQPDYKAGEKIDCGDGAESKEEVAGSSASPLLMVIAWFLGGALALWLYFQLAGLLKLVLECQGWRLWVAIGLFAIPFGALVYIVIKFLIVFGKLPAREQVKGNLQTSDIAESEALADSLKPYLFELPEDYDIVFERKNREEIKSRIMKLRDDTYYSDANGWIKDFARFQKDQEDRALDIVKTYCKLVALKTAACPWKAIDMVIVFVNSTLMIEKIAKVYNRRVTKAGAVRLLCRWFMNIYISGELGAITENATHHASDKVAAWLTKDNSSNAAASGAEAATGQMADGVANNISDGGSAESLTGVFTASLPILSKFVGKAVEGAINAYFAYRMGRRAIDEFRCVIPVKE